MTVDAPPPIVTADPRCKLSYQTYVLGAFLRAGLRVRFRRLDCPRGSGMALLVGERRVWVHTDDNRDDVPEAPRAWADTVARVNVRRDVPDVLPLGPLFGIQIWPLPLGYTEVIRLACGGANLRRASQYVRFQGVTRLGIDEYVPGESDPSYVFLRSRPWLGQHQWTVEARLRFIEAVGELPVDADVLVADERIDLSTYVQRTRRSAVAFVNPGAHGCLGWKLGEYLALGKAIVSLPIDNALPAPLEHGVHVHYVNDDVGEMRDAVQRLAGDDEYRHRLERGARSWYEAHMSPARVAERLVDGT